MSKSKGKDTSKIAVTEPRTVARPADLRRAAVLALDAGHSVAQVMASVGNGELNGHALDMDKGVRQDADAVIAGVRFLSRCDRANANPFRVLARSARVREAGYRAAMAAHTPVGISVDGLLSAPRAPVAPVALPALPGPIAETKALKVLPTADVGSNGKEAEAK